MAIFEYLRSLLTQFGVTPDHLPYIVGVVAIFGFAFLARPFLNRVGRVIEAIFLHNWQLGLLGTTGLVLSLASGWTTWDGMKNFTGDAILSAMVTFGIQGVMLIVAWLIGESFATGMNQRPVGGEYTQAGGNIKTTIKVASGLVLFGLTLALSALAAYSVSTGVRPDSGQMAEWLGLAGGCILAIGLLIVASHVPTLRGYFDAMRVIVRTAMLWVMFLACMATSVFFSFDSLFSTIFPQSERVRAAELRAQNQVSGVIADIGQTITRGLLRETEQLFATDGWKAYDEQLSNLAGRANGSKKIIEDYFQKQMEDNRTAIAKQQERIATSNSSAAGLIAKKTAMTDELARLKADRPSLADDFTKHKGDVDAIMKDLDAKRVEAMAEQRGVEGTGKVGEGPMYRQRKAEEQALRDKLKIAQERLNDAQKRFVQVDGRLTQIERELSLMDGDIAKLKGEAQTAEQRIKLADEAQAAGEGPKLDPTRIIPAFEKARAEFRQTPKLEGLAQVQTLCSQLISSLSNPATKDKITGIDCDPKTAAEAASRVFSLNAGVVAFDANCASGDKLIAYKTADDLFGFARKCVQDSGLPSKDTDVLRQKINFIELNRDDKANRFVVTWNAFSDGNRLAYLSLSIAIAVDALVFLSGLFGANAVRSPLSDVPTTKARNATDLERIIDNALLPHRFENARIMIEAMHADTSVPGYSAIVDLRDLDPQSQTVVRRILNAGATIGAVLRDPNEPAVYAVRPELFEYLSIAGARAFERHGKMVEEDIAEKVRAADLEKQVRVALLPDEYENVEAVLSYAHPINVTADGFMSEILLAEVAPHFILPVRSVLNVGAAHNLVQREKGTSGRYEIHADLYKVLSRIRGRMLVGASRDALQLPRQGGADGRSALLKPAPYRIASAAASQSAQQSGAQSEGNPIAQPANDLGLSPAPQTMPLPPTIADMARAEHNRQKPAAATRPLPADEIQNAATRGASAEFDRDLCDHFSNEMLSFSPEQLTYVRDQSPTIDVAALEMALGNVMRYDDGLRQALQQAKKGLEDSIEAARGSFDGFATGPADAAARLNAFADRLKDLTALMVLMPGQAYSNIIQSMSVALDDDHAAGRLDAYRAAQRDLLRRHLAELSAADRSDDHWGAIAQSLNAFGRGMATLAAKAESRPAGRV